MKRIAFLMLVCAFSVRGFAQPKLQVIKDDMTYDKLSVCKDGMISFKKANKYGYLNKSGAEVIPAQFDDAYDFSDGYAGAKKDGKWGIIDKTGKWKIEPQFSYVGYLVKGNLFQYYDSSKWGVRTLNGDIIIPAKYSIPEMFPKFLKISTGSYPTSYSLYSAKGKELLTSMDVIECDNKSDIAIVRKGDVNKIIDAEGKVTCDSLDAYTLSAVKNNLVVLKNKQSGLYGICDRFGKMVIPCDAYIELTADKEEDLFKAGKKFTAWGKSETKYGYIDKTGKVVIPVQHAYLWAFKNGLAAARDSLSGKVGFYNDKGVLEIPKKYEYVADFGSNALSKVSLKINDKLEEHYITAKGVDIGKSDAAYPAAFSEGVGVLKKPDHFVVTDKNKAQKKVEGYKDQYNISEGVFVVTNKEGKYGYVDLTGKNIIACQYDFAGFFKGGMAYVGKKVKVNNKDKNLYGYVAKDGTEILPGSLLEAGDFNDGYALVKDENSTEKYFINTKGEKQQLPNKYAAIYAFKEGYAVAQSNSKITDGNNKWIFLNTKLQEVDSVISTSLYFISDGYTILTGTEYKILDKSMKQVGSFKYENMDSIKTFSEGMMCYKDKTTKKWAFKNTKGETVIEPQFTSTSTFKEGLCAVLTDKGWGYINNKGAYVIPAGFETASNFNSGFAVIKKGGMYGYIDKTGKFWMEPKYNRLTDFTDGKAVMKIDNVYTLVKEPA